jgi:hypothetical protein
VHLEDGTILSADLLVGADGERVSYSTSKPIIPDAKLSEVTYKSSFQ